MKYLEFPDGWAGPVSDFEKYLLASGRSPKTLRVRKSWLKTFARWIDMGPFQIDSTAVIEWSSRQNWSQATRRSAHQSLKLFYTWAASRDLIDEVPIIPGVKKAPPNPHPASDGALNACLLSGDWRVRLAARLSAELGLRRGEVACINADRDLIETAEGAALVVHGKGGKRRIVPLPASLASVLRGFSGFIFPGQDEGHLSAEWLGHLISRAMPEGVTMHGLRHRFTTRAYRQTKDLVAVQKILGHSSPETTLVYLQLADDSLRRVVEAAA